jgi:pSer/pThr/pTyr-binding forkhead associated (FHA) protein
MCGEMNKLDVRFCEHCGTRLLPPVTESSAMSGANRVVNALTCGHCGAIVLPGEAFCDNCGHAVVSATSQTSASMQVVDLPPEGFAETPQNMNDFHRSESTAVSGGVEYHIEDDQSTPAADVPPVVDVVVPPLGAYEQGDVVVPDAPVDAVEVPVVVMPEPANPVMAGEVPPVELPPVVEAEAPVEAEALVDATTAVEAEIEPDVEPALEYELSEDEVPPPALSAVDIQVLKSKRQELEAEVKRQKDIMQQLDQMRRAFREVTPQAVLMGLSEAEEKLRAAESELQSLPIPPEIDPAVIERLQKDLARQIEIIEQFEQLQKTFGSATPRAVLQGITDARETESAIRAELKALGVDMLPPKALHADEVILPPVVAPPPAGEAVAKPAEVFANIPPAPVKEPLAPRPADVPAPVVMPPPQANALVPADPSTAVERPVNPVVNPVIPAARLQLESGTVLPLPVGRREIIIGRDDPISGVHPEIDLTPYGAESGGVSRRHVRLTVIDGQWMITDLQSTNHTRVNGVRIDPGVPTQLPDGAQVVLGRIGFIFRCV